MDVFFGEIGNCHLYSLYLHNVIRLEIDEEHYIFLAILYLLKPAADW